MTTDFRALCAELLDEVVARPLILDRELIARARAALADEPAVPECREPVAVTGQPSDENCWQWYTYCPEEGLEMYSDREQAQSAAQSIMGSYEVAAYSDGWHEDMESVSWGMLVPVELAQVVERKTAEPGNEFDEWVKYKLVPARGGRQPAPPANGEVAELVAWLRSNALTVKKASGNPANGARQRMNRAAELLQWQALVPVPVSERPWEREGWCDTNGLCWLGSDALDGCTPTWLYGPPAWAERFPNVHRVLLPAHALPLPEVGQ